MVHDKLGMLYMLFCLAVDDNLDDAGVILHRFSEENMTFLNFAELFMYESDAELLMGELREGGYFPISIHATYEMHGDEGLRFIGIFIPENISIEEAVKYLKKDCGELSEISNVIVSDDNVDLLMLSYSYEYVPKDLGDLDNYDYCVFDQDGKYVPLLALGVIN